jgi:carboxypeptidase Q
MPIGAFGCTLRAPMPRRALLLMLSLTACSPSAAPLSSDGGAVDVGPGAASAASVVAASVAIPSPAKEPESVGRTLRETTLESSQAFDTVRSLVDEVGPRLAGSPGSKAAVAWGLRTLSAAGLTRVHAEKVMVPHWERGEERGEIISPFPHVVTLTALGGSVGTPANGLEAEVIEVDSLEAVDKLDPAIVKGKIVFFYVKMERARDGSGYGRAVGVRGAGASRAAKLGAAGVVIRSIGTDNSRLPHTGAMRYDDKFPKIPAAALSVVDAEMLHRILALGKPVRFRMSLGAKSLPDAEDANVVGDVEGSEIPSEIVLLGAHLDSWDLGQGALDDGAGCGIIIEAARQIGRLPKKPRRTVRVVLYANEENGLAGARAYAKEHEAELSKHILALEADSGAGRVYEARFLGDEAKRPQFVSLIDLVKAIGVEPSPASAHGGADLSPLLAAGVPVMDLRQDSSLYFDVHHTANDTMEQVRKVDLDQVTAAFAAVAYGAADGAGDFGRIPEDKRKRR